MGNAENLKNLTDITGSERPAILVREPQNKGARWPTTRERPREGVIKILGKRQKCQACLDECEERGHALCSFPFRSILFCPQKRKADFCSSCEFT